MAKPTTNRDLETLIAETEKHRIRMQKALEKAENPDAAIESAKETLNKIKSGRPGTKGKYSRYYFRRLKILCWVRRNVCMIPSRSSTFIAVI